MNLRLNKGIGAAALLMVACGSAQARDLTVVSFGGALQDAVRGAFITPFVKATGIPVVEDTYDGSLSKISSQIEAKSLKWDVVDLESSELIQGCQEGSFEELDWSKLGDKSKLVPAAAKTSACGVGYMTGAMVLTYDAAKLATAPQTWADFWDTKKFPGRRGLRFGPKWTLEVALIADGVAPSKVYDVLSTPAGVDRAFAKLTELKPSITWWKLGAESIQQLAAGETAMTAAYNGRVVAADRAEGRKFDMVWKAGSVYFMDYFAILKGTPNLASAEKFIGYALSTTAQKSFPTFIGYGPANLEAFKGMDPTVAADLPDADRMASSVYTSDDFWLNHNEELTQRFNVWAAK